MTESSETQPSASFGPLQSGSELLDLAPVSFLVNDWRWRAFLSSPGRE